MFRRPSGPSLRGAVLGLPLVLLLPLAVAPPAAAQGPRDFGTETPSPPRMQAGGAFLVGQPLGEFRDYVRAGFGLDGFWRVGLDPEGWVSLRVDGAFLVYGQETNRVCLSTTVGCRIQVDVTTSNTILAGGVGPELAIPLGSAGGGIYAGMSAGFSYFSTDSQVRGSLEPSDSPFASTRNYSDGGFAWTSSGGIRIPVGPRGGTPLFVDLGVRRVGSGRREYLTQGDISERPDGSLEFNVRRSEADLLLWRIGVAVGLGGRPDA
jgi:hypothetical protein